ncbi:unnamed protein product [Rotaria sp. Silwood2]|nr:unnamed protein product [Rotaria sp. Silwood2]CAF4409552.1 unnamed protein product [Rotaria sp. Silwood2]
MIILPISKDDVHNRNYIVEKQQVGRLALQNINDSLQKFTCRATDLTLDLSIIHSPQACYDLFGTINHRGSV